MRDMIENHGIFYLDNVVKRYGEYLKDVDISNVSCSCHDMSGIQFADDTEIFQRIYSKNLGYAKFPSIDLGFYNFNGVMLEGADLRRCYGLERNLDFFVNLRYKSISKVVLPEGDYSKHNFTGVNIAGAVFSKNSKLPTNRDFFRSIRGRDLRKSELPVLDLRLYDLSGVYIKGVVFAEGTKFPEDKEFFQKVKWKNISFSSFPNYDYSLYDFKGVCMNYASFGNDSEFPYDCNFLKNLGGARCTVLGDKVRDNIHLYDLHNLGYVFEIEGNMSLEQKTILLCNHKEEFESGMLKFVQ